jgi:hypothetical protein
LKRFFQTTTPNNLERFQFKLSPKAKEAFEQINRVAQERLENDQIKVLLIRIKSKIRRILFRLNVHNGI